MANPLTLVSASFDTAGQKFGSGALSGGYGLAPTGLISAYPFTIEGWFKRPTAPSGLEVIAGQQSLFYLAMWSSGMISFDVTGGSVTAPTSSADGAWHHIALVCPSATAFSGYLDGVALGSAVSSNGALQPGSLAIANYGGDAQYQFGGETDEFVLWPTERYTGDSFALPGAYSGNEGMTALWHLDGNGADSAMAGVVTLPKFRWGFHAVAGLGEPGAG